MPDSPPFSRNYLLLLLFILLLALSSVYVPQVLGEDPGTALAAWQSMLLGGPFNSIRLPNPQDISQDNYLFVTWWTPGHYLLPGLFSKLGLSLGAASLVLTFIFSILGLVGWYKVYERLNIDPEILFFCLCMIASSRLFTTNFVNYTGGELLIFGGQPWSIYIFLKYQHKPVRLFCGLLVVSLVCFFLKSSYTIGLGAIGICAGLFFVENWQNPSHRKNAFWSMTAVFCCCVVYFAVTQWGFLKLGANPTSSQGAFNLFAPSYEILSYPFLQWLGIGDFYNLLQRRHFIIDLRLVNVLYHILSIAGLFLIGFIVWKIPKSSAKTLFMGFYLMYIAVFLYLFNTSADVSLEHRHLKILAYLFLPLLCQYLQPYRNTYAVLIVILLVANTSYGLLTYVLKKKEVYQTYVTGKSGYAIKFLTQSDLDFIHSKDDPAHPERIWFFVPTSPNVEVKYGRKLLSGFNFEASRIGNYVHNTYQSKSEKIFCVLNRHFDQKSAHPSLSKMFPEYRFKVVKTSHEIVIYEGVPLVN